MSQGWRGYDGRGTEVTVSLTYGVQAFWQLPRGIPVRLFPLAERLHSLDLGWKKGWRDGGGKALSWNSVSAGIIEFLARTLDLSLLVRAGTFLFCCLRRGARAASFRPGFFPKSMSEGILEAFSKAPIILVLTVGAGLC